jgi:hypothetical protein
MKKGKLFLAAHFAIMIFKVSWRRLPAKIKNLIHFFYLSGKPEQPDVPDLISLLFLSW